MLGFFPHPYPDEILYSVLARYHVRSGNVTAKATLAELFDSAATAAVVDLPSNIDGLLLRLPLGSAYNSNQIIFQHTLFPLYQPFIPKERAEKLLQSMKDASGGSIHSRAGIMASSIPCIQYLRFCPACIEADRNKYGEAYWHRVHQVPGVLICPLHEEDVFDSEAIHGLNQRMFIPVCLDKCRVPAMGSQYDQKTKYGLFQIAKQCDWLLQHHLTPHNFQYFKDHYFGRLAEMGLVSPGGRFVDQVSIEQQFRAYYGTELLRKLWSDYEDGQDVNWLRTITRKLRKVIHPLRHILLIVFLCQSVEKFFSSVATYKPFGDSPWPCLNPVAEHYRHDRVLNICITTCCDTGKPVGTFRCACGFTYSRRGPDTKEEDRYRIGRIKEFGSMWEDKLKAIIQSGTHSLRSIARQMQADPGTIKKHATRLGLWQGQEVILVSDTDKKGTAEINQTRRSEWLKLREDYPQYSKTELRSIGQATYAWLYRHDREWLNQNSPVSKKEIIVRTKIDWSQRDKEICTEVQKTVGQLLASEEKPIRITISRVGNMSGYRALIEKHIEKLPATSEYLQSVQESVTEFQIRRVQWAAQHLHQQGVSVDGWRIMRIAGLKGCEEICVLAEVTAQSNDFSFS